MVKNSLAKVCFLEINICCQCLIFDCGQEKKNFEIPKCITSCQNKKNVFFIFVSLTVLDRQVLLAAKSDQRNKYRTVSFPTGPRNFRRHLGRIGLLSFLYQLDIFCIAFFQKVCWYNLFAKIVL